MLGIARASQYAGWAGGPLKPAFKSTSTLTKTLSLSGASLLLSGPAVGEITNISLNTTATFDITGMTAVSEYNNKKMLLSSTVLPSLDSGLSDGYYGSLGYISLTYPGYEDSTAPGKLNSNIDVSLYIDNGQLEIRAGWDTGEANRVKLAGAYTDWTSTWLTFVFAASNDSADFAGHTGGGTWGADRLSVYNSETGQLLGTSDNAPSTEFVDRIGLSDFTSTTVSTTGSDSTVNRISWQAFNGGGQQFRLSNMWFTLGQTIDPASIVTGTQASSVWTTMPSQVLGGNVSALVTIGLSDYELDGTQDYYATQTNMGKFTQTDDRFNSVWTIPTADFLNQWSTTLIPKDET